MLVFIHKHDVQVTAVAQLFAAELAVGEDGKLWFVAMALLEVLPHPTAGDFQYRIGQCAQVVGHLFDGDAAFHVTRQSAEHFGMVGAAQQVEQGFFVGLSGGLQRVQATL